MLKGVVIDDTQLFNDELAEWETFYNYHRPHGALGGQTPTNAYGRRPPQPRPRVNDLRQLHSGAMTALRR
jgi:transposase InsO family protein